MRSSVSVLNEICETLVEGKEPGDPDSVIQKPEVSVSALTKNADQMKTTTNVSCPQGMIILLPLDQLFGNHTPSCIDIKVIPLNCPQHPFRCSVTFYFFV